MRGLKVGVWLLGVAVVGLMIPLRAQGATAEQYVAAGQQLYTAKDYAKAIQYYSAAVKVNPNSGPAYQGIGNCLYGLGRKSDALAYYRRASALQPNNTQLAQFVQSLSAQVSAGGGMAAPAGGMGGDALAQGMSFFQQKQYAASIPYFLQAIQQNPNNDKAYYYAGYSYYMTRDAKNAALYFGVSNAKSPNASVKAYADRIKSSLPAEDQQWVDDQVSRYSSGAMAGTSSGSGKKSDMTFGFHILGGTEYVLSDPAQIKDYVTAAGSVSLNGVTPNLIPLAELEPFVQISDTFEINLACSYFPVGNLSYTWVPYAPVTFNDGSQSTNNYRYSYNTTLVSGGAGVKLLFGDKGVKGYFGLGGDVTPISMTFSKVQIDGSGNALAVDPSGGDYTTLAIGGHARLGVDFSLGKSISFGPYIGFKYLSATNFKNAAGTLVVNTGNGDVGNSSLADPSVPTKPLEMDFSGINGGIDLTFSF